MEIWSPRITKYFNERLLAGNFFSDFSADLAEGGDIVHLPKMSQRFSVGDINTTSGEVSATDVSDTSSTLAVDNWKGTGMYLSKFQQRQIHNKYSVLDGYASGMAQDLAKNFDTALWGKTTSTELSDSVGDSATDILSTSIEKALSIVESNSIPLEDMAFFFHPYAYYREILGTQKYYDASQAGWDSDSAPIAGSLKKARKGTLYGAPVYVSSQIPEGTTGSEGGHRNVLVHPELTAYAIQGGVQLAEKSGEHLRKKVSADIPYGAANLRSDAGVRIISNN